MDRALFEKIVSTANLAPSVHNTQPARWRLGRDGSLLVLADLDRHLAAGDPTGRDMGVSCGTAAEGTVMALAEAGIGVRAVEDCWAANDMTAAPGHRLAARIVAGGAATADPLADAVRARFTWRGRFDPASPASLGALRDRLAASGDAILVEDASAIGSLAEMADAASVPLFRDTHFRRELVHWMRLSRSHPRYRTDGLNLDALRMSPIEGWGASLVLGTPLFGAVDALGLTRALTGERAKTATASAIVLFHRPRAETPVASGRAFYRAWLAVTRSGLAAWPLAVLADDEACAADCARRFGIPDERRLVNVLRVGASAHPPATGRARLAPGDLVLDQQAPAPRSDAGR